MKSLNDYIDLYGLNGWKASGPENAPMVMMLLDEIATPGSTDLSHLDRFVIESAASQLRGDATDDRTLQESSITSLRIAPYASQLGEITDIASARPAMDLEAKNLASIVSVHGEQDNPFTRHTDYIQNDRTVVKDALVNTDLQMLRDYYSGAINATIFGYNILTESIVITSNAIFTKLLSMVVQYGIASATEVQETFGSYAPAVVSAALAVETKLPPLSAMSDPLADSMFKAYLAYFGRPADPAGLQFWIDKINLSGSTVADMVQNFGDSDEYVSLYGTVNSSTVINSLYQHLFNRDAETGAVPFWSKQLEDGHFTLSNIAFTLVNSAQGSDATIVAEKVIAATAFVTAMDTQREWDLYSNNTSALNARKWLSTISADHTANIQVVNLVGQVIDGLQSGVDGILAAHGLHAGYY